MRETHVRNLYLLTQLDSVHSFPVKNLPCNPTATIHLLQEGDLRDTKSTICVNGLFWIVFVTTFIPWKCQNQKVRGFWKNVRFIHINGRITTFEWPKVVSEVIFPTSVLWQEPWKYCSPSSKFFFIFFFNTSAARLGLLQFLQSKWKLRRRL